MVKKEEGVVRGVVKKCKSVMKTLKTVVNINCIIPSLRKLAKRHFEGELGCRRNGGGIRGGVRGAGHWPGGQA